MKTTKKYLMFLATGLLGAVVAIMISLSVITEGSASPGNYFKEFVHHGAFSGNHNVYTFTLIDGTYCVVLTKSHYKNSNQLQCNFQGK